MVLLRSKEDVDDWCRANHEPRGAVIPLELAWQLSHAYFGDRLHADYRGHSDDEFRAMFQRLGLDSDFWLR